MRTLFVGDFSSGCHNVVGRPMLSISDEPYAHRQPPGPRRSPSICHRCRCQSGPFVVASAKIYIVTTITTAVPEELAMLMRLQLPTGLAGSPRVDDRSQYPRSCRKRQGHSQGLGALDPENSGIWRGDGVKRVYGLLVLLRWSLPSRFAWLIAPNQLRLRTGLRRHRRRRPPPRPRS